MRGPKSNYIRKNTRMQKHKDELCDNNYVITKFATAIFAKGGI